MPIVHTSFPNTPPRRYTLVSLVALLIFCFDNDSLCLCCISFNHPAPAISLPSYKLTQDDFDIPVFWPRHGF